MIVPDRAVLDTLGEAVLAMNVTSADISKYGERVIITFVEDVPAWASY